MPVLCRKGMAGISVCVTRVPEEGRDPDLVGHVLLEQLQQSVERVEVGGPSDTKK